MYDQYLLFNLQVNFHAVFEQLVKHDLDEDEPVIVNDYNWLKRLNDLIIEKLADRYTMRYEKCS